MTGYVNNRLSTELSQIAIVIITIAGCKIIIRNTNSYTPSENHVCCLYVT